HDLPFRSSGLSPSSSVRPHLIKESRARVTISRVAFWPEECLGAGPENRRADADVGRAMRHGLLVLGAHAHREEGKAVPLGDLGEKREMRRGGLTDRGNAHQPRDHKAVALAAGFDESIGLRWRDAGLRGFLS